MRSQRTFQRLCCAVSIGPTVLDYYHIKFAADGTRCGSPRNDQINAEQKMSLYARNRSINREDGDEYKDILYSKQCTARPRPGSSTFARWRYNSIYWLRTLVSNNSSNKRSK